jgi:predicted HTH transcriptional regulator
MILRSSLRQESTRFGWLVVITFTGVSIGFNIAHSPEDFISQAAHAVPPITLMVRIEMFTMIIRSDLKVEHGTSVSHVTSPEADVIVPDVPLPKRKVTDEEVLHFFRCNTEATFIDAAEALQVTRQTISRNVSRLVEEGRLAREGKSLVVVLNQEKR